MLRSTYGFQFSSAHVESPCTGTPLYWNAHVLERPCTGTGRASPKTNCREKNNSCNKLLPFYSKGIFGFSVAYYYYYYYSYYFEGVCGRATNVILAPSAGCKGFARRSVTSVPARKAEQGGARRTSSRIKPDHHMLCRNFACWLPKSGLLL